MSSLKAVNNYIDETFQTQDQLLDEVLASNHENGMPSIKLFT